MRNKASVYAVCMVATVMWGLNHVFKHVARQKVTQRKTQLLCVLGKPLRRSSALTMWVDGFLCQSGFKLILSAA